MRHLDYCVLTIILLLCCGCSVFKSKDKPEKELTEKQAVKLFDEKTLEEGAHFYNINRDKFPFLDSLYFEECFPLFPECSLIQLKSIFLELKNTPMEQYVYCLYDDMKADYLEGVAEELDSLAFAETSLFIDDVIPLMEIYLDSLISEDLEKVMKQFSGGVLNIKKLSFFTGGTQDRFKEKWENCIDLGRYRDAAKEFSDDFLKEVTEFNNEYYLEATGLDYQRKIDFAVPEIDYKISKNITKHVSDYVDDEVWGMLGSAFKDFLVPAAIDVVTGGAYTCLYEIGNLAYDVKVTYDEIQEMEPTAEEKLIFVCANDVEEAISQRFVEQVKTRMMNQIANENNHLFQEIEAALTVD